jgi:hypothetical protein
MHGQKTIKIYFQVLTQRDGLLKIALIADHLLMVLNDAVNRPQKY